MYQIRSPKAYVAVPTPFSDKQNQLAAECREHAASEAETRTILELRKLGTVSLTVACESPLCGHFGSVKFERLGLPGAASFSAIAGSMRFRCEACKGTAVRLAPALPAPNIEKRARV